MGSNGREHRRGVPRPPPLSLYRDWEEEEVVKVARSSQPPPPPPEQSTSIVATTSAGFANKKKGLSKQLSMKETTREVKWEKRRRQIQRQRSSMRLNEADDRTATACCPVDSEQQASSSSGAEPPRVVAKRITDEDLDELRGSMDLGFRFDEHRGGQDLCDTLPALDLYFAVNRQLSEPKIRFPAASSTPPSLSATKSSPNLCVTPGPGSPNAHSNNPLESWKICSPGDNPQLVKTRLRHWAQVVACSVKHSS